MLRIKESSKDLKKLDNFLGIEDPLPQEESLNNLEDDMKAVDLSKQSLQEDLSVVQPMIDEAWPYVKKYMDWYCDPATVDEYDRYIEPGRTFDEQIRYDLFEDPNMWFDPEVGIVLTGWDEDEDLGEILFEAEENLSEEDYNTLINELISKAKEYAKQILDSRKQPTVESVKKPKVKKKINEAKFKSPQELEDFAMELESIKADYEDFGPDGFYSVPFKTIERDYPLFAREIIKTFLLEMGILTSSEISNIDELEDEEGNYWNTGRLITPEDWPALIDGAERLLTFRKDKGIQWEKIYKTHYKPVDEELGDDIEVEDAGMDKDNRFHVYNVKRKEAEPVSEGYNDSVYCDDDNPTAAFEAAGLMDLYNEIIDSGLDLMLEETTHYDSNDDYWEAPTLTIYLGDDYYGDNKALSQLARICRKYGKVVEKQGGEDMYVVLVPKSSGATPANRPNSLKSAVAADESLTEDSNFLYNYAGPQLKNFNQEKYEENVNTLHNLFVGWLEKIKNGLGIKFNPGWKSGELEGNDRVKLSIDDNDEFEFKLIFLLPDREFEDISAKVIASVRHKNSFDSVDFDTCSAKATPNGEVKIFFDDIDGLVQKAILLRNNPELRKKFIDTRDFSLLKTDNSKYESLTEGFKNWTEVYDLFGACADRFFPDEEAVREAARQIYEIFKGDPDVEEAWKRWNDSSDEED